VRLGAVTKETVVPLTDATSRSSQAPTLVVLPLEPCRFTSRALSPTAKSLASATVTEPLTALTTVHASAEVFPGRVARDARGAVAAGSVEQALIVIAVTVVVQAVPGVRSVPAVFSAARVDRRVGVVTVRSGDGQGAGGLVAVVVVIHIGHTGRAVVLRGRAGEGGGVGVVTVVVVINEARGRLAGGRAGGGVAEQVAVVIGEPDRGVEGVGLVHHAVTVVVYAVTQLGVVGGDLRAVIVAVLGVPHEAAGSSQASTGASRSPKPSPSRSA
jgi:hypothetical protein